MYVRDYNDECKMVRGAGTLTARIVDFPNGKKKIGIGYSFRNSDAGDVYDKEKGIILSEERVEYLKHANYKKHRIPPRHRHVVLRFISRAKKIFTGYELVSWADSFLHDNDNIEQLRDFYIGKYKTPDEVDEILAKILG